MGGGIVMKPFSLEEYLENPSRKIITRDGRNVKIHCTNFDEFTPIIAEIEDDIYSTAFCKNGKIIDDKDTSCDLFFAPELHEGWINVYKWGDNYRYTGDVFSSKEKALENIKGCDNVATIKIEWEE